MPTVRDIVGFLARIGQTSDKSESVDEVSHGAPDREARAGAIAWLSPRRLKEDPERVSSFRGAVLLAPDDAPKANAVVRCRNPKLAFIRVSQQYFAHQADIRWRVPGVENDHSELSPGVVMGGDVNIGSGCVIGPNTVLANCTIGSNVIIGANCSIGLAGFGYERDDDGRWWRFPHVGTVMIEDDVEIGSNSCIDRGALGPTTIRRGSKIDNLVHIAHNVTIGENAMVIANAMLGGSATVESGAWIAPSAAVLNQITIGAGATLGMGAVVLKSVAPGAVVVGNPGRVLERKP